MSSCKKIQSIIKILIPLKANPALDSHRYILDKPYKKTSSSPLRALLRKGINAGMTVEAGLALPFFLFFIANILSLFMMYEKYSKNLATVSEQGKNLAMIAHTADAGGDLVILTLPQQISPLIKEIGFNTAYTSSDVYIRKWTGYNVMSTTDDSIEEEYVYITESGVVYHRSRACSHLKIKISVIDARDINNARNDYGHRYLPCEKCASGNSTGLVFITDKGDRYHNSAGCSGLKRTIITVPLSEVGGRGPCSLCGG